MFSLTTTFFLVEIVVGYATNSMALVADSFHMLSDVVALIVAFLAVRVSGHRPAYRIQLRLRLSDRMLIVISKCLSGVT